MSAANHTPGPWTFSRCDQFGDARFYIAQAEGAPYTPNFSDVATLIAETVSLERVAVQEANARLIAASPKLLAVLIEATEVLEVLRRGHGAEVSGLCFPALNNCRAALVQAGVEA